MEQHPGELGALREKAGGGGGEIDASYKTLSITRLAVTCEPETEHLGMEPRAELIGFFLTNYRRA